MESLGLSLNQKLEHSEHMLRDLAPFDTEPEINTLCRKLFTAGVFLLHQKITAEKNHPDLFSFLEGFLSYHSLYQFHKNNLQKDNPVSDYLKALKSESGKHYFWMPKKNAADPNHPHSALQSRIHIILQRYDTARGRFPKYLRPCSSFDREIFMPLHVVWTHKKTVEIIKSGETSSLDHIINALAKRGYGGVALPKTRDILRFFASLSVGEHNAFLRQKSDVSEDDVIFCLKVLQVLNQKKDLMDALPEKMEDSSVLVKKASRKM